MADIEKTIKALECHKSYAEHNPATTVSSGITLDALALLNAQKENIAFVKYALEATNGRTNYDVGMRNALRLVLYTFTGEDPKYEDCVDEQEAKRYTSHDVACIIADLFGDPCACNFNDIDEWLPYKCDFRDTCCPNPVGVACWEQYLKYKEGR